MTFERNKHNMETPGQICHRVLLDNGLIIHVHVVVKIAFHVWNETLSCQCRHQSCICIPRMSTILVIKYWERNALMGKHAQHLPIRRCDHQFTLAKDWTCLAITDRRPGNSSDRYQESFPKKLWLHKFWSTVTDCGHNDNQIIRALISRFYADEPTYDTTIYTPSSGESEGGGGAINCRVCPLICKQSWPQLTNKRQVPSLTGLLQY